MASVPADVRRHPTLTGTIMKTPHSKHAHFSPRVASEAFQCLTRRPLSHGYLVEGRPDVPDKLAERRANVPLHTLKHSQTHTHTHSHTHTLTHTHTHTLTHSHIHTSHTYTLTHSHTHTLTYSLAQTHTHTHTHTLAHFYTHTHSHTHTPHTHAHTHTHTHSHAPDKPAKHRAYP